MYYMYSNRLGTRFKGSFVCSTFNAKFLPSKLHCQVLFANVWLIMWACCRKVEAVLLAAFVSFLSPAMLNPSRNSDRNKTSTRYKAIIQFLRLSIANQGKSNIDENTCKPSFIFADKA